MAKKDTRTARERRATLRRDEDIHRRLTDLEDLARANRRELDLQFRRMADMQAQIDQVKRRHGSQ